MAEEMTAGERSGLQPPEDPFAVMPKRDDSAVARRDCGHLLRRAAFGATPARMAEMLDWPAADRVEALMAFDPNEDVGGLNAFREQARTLFDIRRNVRMVVDWWFHRMTHTPFPLQERMALFWHDHFATSGGKVGRANWMHDQIELFRTDGLGSFRDLLVKVGRQPAMLRWLDGHNSHKSNPNENYGREILELFAVGVGNYTERDVQELSRAFTGWQIRGNDGRFDKNRFDDGEKVLFAGTPYEQKGKFNDEQAVDAILKHPEAPRFIARKLLRAFVHPEPHAAHVDHYAGRLLHHKWHVGNTLREILSSRLMYGDWCYRSRAKSPVELVVGACYNTGATARTDFLRNASASMGQSLLYPPNVAGWEGGQAWINATTIVERFRFCRDLGQESFNLFVETDLRDHLNTSLGGQQKATAAGVVNELANVMLDGQVPGDVRGRILDYMTRDDNNEPAEFRFDGRGYYHKTRGAVQLLASSPLYQLA